MAKADTGRHGDHEKDFFVTDEVDDTTLVLLAVPASPVTPADRIRLSGVRCEVVFMVRPCSPSADRGIGSGKSTVADLLVDHGAVLIDATGSPVRWWLPTARLRPAGGALRPGILTVEGPSTGLRWPRWPSPTPRP